MLWILGIALVCVSIGGVASNECTDACDSTYSAVGTTQMTFCGTDRRTYTTAFEAIDTDYCYATCGVMAQYTGQCGCANDCYSMTGQGKCDTSNNICVCTSGWGGNDCSIPASGNSCSYHGKFRIGGDSGSAFPYDYCDCDEGFTGIDCSSPIFKGSNLPWGELYPDVPQYSEADKYQDDHPVFNLSHFATIRVTLDENDYISLLLPSNLYNESYASASVSFDNNQVQESFSNVGFRIKGAYSRMDQKKGWVIKFNEFVKGQSLFGVKKIGMKSGSVDDDTLLKTKLYTDLYRAVNAPTQRSSYALLYINNRFAGIYYMHEDIGGDFAAARNMVDKDHYDAKNPSVDTGAGNLYKFFWNVHLGYYGDNVTYYQSRAHVNELGVNMYYYEQSEGDTNWSDFLDMLLYFNTTASLSTVDNVMEVDNLLRGSVVECFMLATDNMASGANYYLYHHNYDTVAKGLKQTSTRWTLFDADFDECFLFDRDSLRPSDADGDILQFFLTDPEVNRYDDVNPLMNLILSPASSYRETYLTHYANMLQHIFGMSSTSSSSVTTSPMLKNNNKNNNPLPQERYADMMQFILPWVERDLLWQFSFNMTAAKFVDDAEFSIAMLPLRAQDTWEQTQRYLQR